jgi:hypothetical protein
MIVRMYDLVGVSAVRVCRTVEVHVTTIAKECTMSDLQRGSIFLQTM